jgi:hypothetical protein
MKIAIAIDMIISLKIAMPHLHEAGFMPRPRDPLKMNPARRLSAVAQGF